MALSLHAVGVWKMINWRVLLPDGGTGLTGSPLAGLLAKCPAVLPGAWNTMYTVSPNAAKELAAVHISVLVTISTGLPAGMMPPGGSSSQPQLSMVAFSATARPAVVLFCTNPRQVLFGQSASRSPMARASGPTRKRTISFCPSAAPGHTSEGLQASTRMLSISKHLVGTCARAGDASRASSGRVRNRAFMDRDAERAAKVALFSNPALTAG